MTHPAPSQLKRRKDQLTNIINLIFVFTGVVFLVRDYYGDYLVDGYWSPGSMRLVQLIAIGILNLVLSKLNLTGTAKFITSVALILVFFLSPIFIPVNYLEMYYINTLLLPVIVLIPSMVFAARKDRILIVSLFVAALASNFLCEQIIFRFKSVARADLAFYNYHFVVFSMAKVMTSLFIYINITHLFRQNEKFEEAITRANDELNENNRLINSQKSRIEEQNIALKKTEEELRNLDVAKSHFFANISHEFRTPLTLILGPLAERLAGTTDYAEKKQFTLMQRSAQRLLNLVNQLLDLSKLESGTLRLEASRHDGGEFFRQVAAQFTTLARTREIDFTFHVPDDLALWFDGDKLEKILSNLLSNAFKFTPRGGNVSLAVTVVSDHDDFREGCAVIEISDSGIGIEAGKLEKIFDRFYQVSDSSRREFEGTGIGLALVKELVELHRGKIHVASQPGQGTVFTVSLPLGKAHLHEDEIREAETEYQFLPARVQEMEELPEGEPVKKEEQPRVLVVEDNADLRSYLKRALRETYHVTFAVNGQEAREIALADQPDLIITDLMMPVMDGMELVKQIKSDERTCHIPVILLTAKADFNTRLEGIETGADDHIAKPFEVAELKARVRNLIEGRKMLREKFSVPLEVRPNDIKAESLDERFLKKVLQSIEHHIGDEHFSMDVLMKEVGMSHVQIYRKLKVLTGKAPNDLIRHMRLDRAMALLDQHAGNVSEVAYQTGFRNMSYFAKCFREKFGMSPGEVGKSVGGSVNALHSRHLSR